MDFLILVQALCPCDGYTHHEQKEFQEIACYSLTSGLKYTEAYTLYTMLQGDAIELCLSSHLFPLILLETKCTAIFVCIDNKHVCQKLSVTISIMDKYVKNSLSGLCMDYVV